MSSLNNVANEMEKLGRSDCAQTLKFLSKISSMSLVPDSINIPFKPMYDNYLNGKKPLSQMILTKPIFNSLKKS